MSLFVVALCHHGNASPAVSTPPPPPAPPPLWSAQCEEQSYTTCSRHDQDRLPLKLLHTGKNGWRKVWIMRTYVEMSLVVMDKISAVAFHGNMPFHTTWNHSKLSHLRRLTQNICLLLPKTDETLGLTKYLYNFMYVPYEIKQFSESIRCYSVHLIIRKNEIPKV